MMNQTQPSLLSQPHREGKRTQSAQMALHSFCANGKLESTSKNHEWIMLNVLMKLLTV